jgi:hypothetical protein
MFFSGIDKAREDVEEIEEGRRRRIAAERGRCVSFVDVGTACRLNQQSPCAVAAVIVSEESSRQLALEQV